MDVQGLQKARQLTADGFYYDNLMKMAACCREESDPNKLLTAYVLNRVFSDLALELGDRPVISTVVRKLEVRYQTAVNLALEKAIAGDPPEEQTRRLTEVIQLLRDAEASA